MKITWIGHSCFRIECNDFTVITDPYAPGSVPGLKNVAEEAQLVCCSHEHGDHAYRDGVIIVRSDGSAPKITTINSWHDEVKGAKRGPNTIQIFDFGEEKAVHLGDLGCDLTENEIDILKNADVLMIPVGGYYTIGPDQAADLVKRIHPRIAIPMHYRDERMQFGYDIIGTVDSFLKAFDGTVYEAGDCIDTDNDVCSDSLNIVKMIPRNANFSSLVL